MSRLISPGASGESRTVGETVMDALTAQRLQSFAAACRQEIKTRRERAAAGNSLPSFATGMLRMVTPG